MTQRDFTLLVRQTAKGKNAHRGVAYVYVGEVGKPYDPLHTEGWYDLGRPISIPDFVKNIDKEKISGGYPKATIMNIPKEDSRELAFTFDMYKLQTLQMATANIAAITISYATDGQTTVASGGTTTSAVLQTGLAAEFKPGEAAIVGTKHATYGGYDEMTIITKTDEDTDTVYFEPLSVAPANSATFKKIAGKVTGTTSADTGIIIPDALTLEFPRVALLVVVNVVSARSLMVVHIPEFEIFQGSMPNFTDALAKCGFTGSPIIQVEKSFTLEDGTSQDLPWYSEYFMVPYEVAVVP